MKPCESCPTILCAQAGICWGDLYWLGKPMAKKDQKQIGNVKECKHIERCRKWYRSES